MASTSNTNPRRAPGWTSRILFRTGTVQTYRWFNYPGLYEPLSAEIAAHRLLCEGLKVLVCTSEEFDEIGLPQTFAGDEYFQPDPARPVPDPPRQAGKTPAAHPRSATVAQPVKANTG